MQNSTRPLEPRRRMPPPSAPPMPRRPSDTSSSDLNYDHNKHHNPLKNTTADDSDDDVPLARAIPNALKAQKSIRSTSRAAHDRARRPTAAAHLVPALPTSRPRTAEYHPDAPQRQRTVSEHPRRQATQLAPGTAPPDELSRRLQDLQIPNVPGSNLQRAPTARRRGLSDGDPASEALVGVGGRTIVPTIPRSLATDMDISLGLHPDRAIPSLSRPNTSRRPSMTKDQDVTSNVPNLPTQGLPRTRPRAGTLDAGKYAATSHTPRRSLEESGSHVPPLPKAANDVLSRRSTSKSRAGRDASPLPPPAMPATPVPSYSPPSYSTATHTNPKDAGEEQRIFIGDRQRFCLMRIGPTTRARDLLVSAAAQDELDQDQADGGWMVFDIANDTGLERPVRDYEIILTDVCNSWADSKGMKMNFLMIKKTHLRRALSHKHIPTVSPMFSGLVQCEAKKGKWVKRYLSLREHSLFLGKKENSKDEAYLCSLSNFDAFVLTRPSRSTPKPFVFALRTTDNPNMFEKATDAVHYFACDKEEGERWVEKIMVARSYVLHQERKVLFPQSSTTTAASSSVPPLPAPSAPAVQSYNGPHRHPTVRHKPLVDIQALTALPATANNNAPPSPVHGSFAAASGSLSRAPTTRRRGERPQEPLVNIPSNPFNEGSLLAKAAAKAGGV